MQRWGTGWLAFAAALCLAGCGGGGADYSSPKATFQTMLQAAKEGNKEAVMACFAQETRQAFAELEKLAREMAAKTPAVETQGTSEFAKKFQDAAFEYGETKIEGNKATLDVTVDGGAETIHFVQEDGAWKIAVPEIHKAIGLMKAKGEALHKALEHAAKKGKE